MKILDRVKEQAEHAAVRAKEGIEEAQTRRELGQLHADLGREAFRLHEAGELAHPVLDGFAEKIRAVQARLEEEEPQVAEPAPK